MTLKLKLLQPEKEKKLDLTLILVTHRVPIRQESYITPFTGDLEHCELEDHK